MSDEIIRLVDSIHREKGIDKKVVFDSVEQALHSAAKRRHPDIEELRVRIDRTDGAIRILDGDIPLERVTIDDLGRIEAQTAKQVMFQRIREAERDVVYDEYERRTDELVSGTIQRVEHGTVIVNLGRVDGILPRQEQVYTETYRPGETMRFYVLAVKKKGQKVLIILSRTHPHLVRELFAQDVPEIYDHIVEIKGLVREPGYRTKIAVSSADARVDPVGACVGVRGNRIRNIVEELNGEKIDIVRWNESEEIFMRNSLSPAEIDSIVFERSGSRARVIVPEDQLSLAIGSRGQNVRLSSKLTGYDIDIMTVEEHRALRARGREEIENLPGATDAVVNSMLMSGFESFDDVVELGVDKLMEIKGIGEKRALEMVEFAVEGIHKREEEEERLAAEEAAAKEAARQADAEQLAKAEAALGEDAGTSGEDAPEAAADEESAPEGDADEEDADEGDTDEEDTDEEDTDEEEDEETDDDEDAGDDAPEEDDDASAAAPDEEEEPSPSA